MHILEELYTGNVRPGERSYRQNSQYSRAPAQAVESGDDRRPLTDDDYIFRRHNEALHRGREI